MKFHTKVMFVSVFIFAFILFLISPFSLTTSKAKAEPLHTGNLMESNESGVLQGELVFAHILFRHGDRTPIEPYPTDPWRNESDWSTGFGQLTNIGKNQHYQLGMWFKKRYSSLISSPSYSRNIIYVQSTDVDRTLMSAASNLAGMFPPSSSQRWNKEILWQPIPIHTIPEKLDNILALKKSCPAYDEEQASVRNSEEFVKLDQRLSYLYDYLSEKTGKTVNTIEGIQRINNTLTIEVIYNKTLPPWTEKVFPSTDMAYASDLTFKVLTYTKKLARLKAGPLLKEILKRFNDKSIGELMPNRSIWMYSAHDTTVASLLNTLGLFEMHSPPYAATVLLEMRILNKIPLVSIFYKTTLQNPKPLLIPNCGIQCPLSKMYELYKDVIPDNWDSECSAPSFFSSYLKSENNDRISLMTLLALVGGGCLVVTLAYFAIVYYRRKHYVRVLVY